MEEDSVGVVVQDTTTVTLEKPMNAIVDVVHDPAQLLTSDFMENGE